MHHVSEWPAPYFDTTIKIPASDSSVVVEHFFVCTVAVLSLAKAVSFHPRPSLVTLGFLPTRQIHFDDALAPSQEARVIPRRELHRGALLNRKVVVLINIERNLGRGDVQM